MSFAWHLSGIGAWNVKIIRVYLTSLIPVLCDTIWLWDHSVLISDQSGNLFWSFLGFLLACQSHVYVYGHNPFNKEMSATGNWLYCEVTRWWIVTLPERSQGCSLFDSPAPSAGGGLSRGHPQAFVVCRTLCTNACFSLHFYDPRKTTSTAMDVVHGLHTCSEGLEACYILK